MKVLSLFDGISCARVALDKAGIPVQAYLASEIDKYSITVSKKNYPDIMHIGDVEKIYIGEDAEIDLLIGGSPCQDLSIAGARKGLAGERIRSILIGLSSFKNVRIVVWSGGGELYARQIAGYIGIKPYVDAYASKNLTGQAEDGSFIFEPDIKPDIAIDDIQSCDLGVLNLICREK